MDITLTSPLSWAHMTRNMKNQFCAVCRRTLQRKIEILRSICKMYFLNRRTYAKPMHDMNSKLPNLSVKLILVFLIWLFIKMLQKYVKHNLDMIFPFIVYAQMMKNRSNEYKQFWTINLIITIWNRFVCWLHTPRRHLHVNLIKCYHLQLLWCITYVNKIWWVYVKSLKNQHIRLYQ